MKLFVLLLLSCFISTPLLAEVVKIDGNTLPRGIEKQSTFTIDVTIEDLKADSFQADYEYEKNVSVQIEKADSSRDLPNTDVGEEDSENIGFVVESRAKVETSTADDGDYYVVVRVTIRQDGKTMSQIIESDDTGNYISIKAFFKGPNEEIGTANFVKIYETLQVANAAPKDFALYGAFKSLRFTWSPETSIQFKTGSEDTDVKNDEPSGAVIVVFSSDADQLTLPTYKFLPDEDSDEAGAACTLDYSKVDTDETCVVCDDNDGQDLIYLDFNKLSSNYSELTVAKVGTGGSGTAKGFDPDKKYGAFMYYLPDGLVRSKCVSAQPTLNLTWSEYNGESQASEGDPRCFIATAVYGSLLDKRINSLRWLRDHVLLTNDFGTNLVAAYYATAPLITPYLNDAPVLKQLTQTLLYPLVVFSDLSKAIGFNWAIVVIMLLALGLFASVRLFWLRIWGTL